MSESSISPDQVTEELQKLYQLFQSGALTSAEYAQAKAKERKLNKIHNSYPAIEIAATQTKSAYAD